MEAEGSGTEEEDASLIQGRGVYRILCRDNGWVYVGCTGASFARRWYLHCLALDQGTHHNQALQADWLALGAAAFVFEVLEFLPPPAFSLEGGDWREKERAWIRVYLDRGGLYNRLV